MVIESGISQKITEIHKKENCTFVSPQKINSQSRLRKIYSLKSRQMKNLLAIACLLLFTNQAWSQLGGARAYAGISALINQDPIANPEGTSHTGYHFGVDARLMSGTMSFIVGGKYTSVSKLPIDGFKLTGHSSQLSMANGRVGLDYSIMSFGEYFRIRTKVLGSIDITLNISEEGVLPADYEYNGGWLGAVGGLGVDIGPVIIDFEYEYGLLNAYSEKKSATFNSWSLSAGVFF